MQTLKGRHQHAFVTCVAEAKIDVAKDVVVSRQEDEQRTITHSSINCKPDGKRVRFIYCVLQHRKPSRGADLMLHRPRNILRYSKGSLLLAHPPTLLLVNNVSHHGGVHNAAVHHCDVLAVSQRRSIGALGETGNE